MSDIIENDRQEKMDRQKKENQRDALERQRSVSEIKEQIERDKNKSREEKENKRRMEQKQLEEKMFERDLQPFGLIKRSKEFLEVGFYLSKFGLITKDDKYPSPPTRLKVDKWNDAYRIFYEFLNGGRTILAFERSLKNARDAFDSHLPSSKRIGWLSDNKKPNPLGNESQLVFDNLPLYG